MLRCKRSVLGHLTTGPCVRCHHFRRTPEHLLSLARSYGTYQDSSSDLTGMRFLIASPAKRVVIPATMIHPRVIPLNPVAARVPAPTVAPMEAPSLWAGMIATVCVMFPMVLEFSHAVKYRVQELNLFRDLIRVLPSNRSDHAANGRGFLPSSCHDLIRF